MTSLAVANYIGYGGLRHSASVSTLVDNRDRRYQLSLGAFLARDKVQFRTASSLYVRCENNPLALVDPSGMFSVSPGAVQSHTGCLNRATTSHFRFLLHKQTSTCVQRAPGNRPGVKP
jgi:RHS repeat-associated protein